MAIPFSSSKIDKSTAISINTIDMHTGGEPLRIITGGYPAIHGETILQKRNYCKSHLDYLRKFLMHEPRGHRDMYGCLIVEPNDSGADFGVLFMHNEGYSTMCGHATIAIAKLAVQQAWVKKEKNGETELIIDAPCGRLKAWVNEESEVRFHNVPAFVLESDCTVDDPVYGEIKFDIAYGGAFYAYLDAVQFKLEIIPENASRFSELGRRLKRNIAKEYVINHPFEKDLGFLYGCIFIGAPKDPRNQSRNICIFADGEVDRSPTGSGVSGRIALHMQKGDIHIGEEIVVESIISSTFKTKAIKEIDFGKYQAWIPEVKGTAYLTGHHQFVLDKEDDYPEGFLL